MFHQTGGRVAASTVRLAAVRAVVVLAVLAGAAGAAGCARTGDAAPPTGPAAGLGAGPTRTVDTTPSHTTPGRNPEGQVPPGPVGRGGGEPAGGAEDQAGAGGASFPDTAAGYADAVLTAWQAGEQDRLGQLSTAQVYDQVVGIPAVPSQGWTDPWCDGTAGSSYCVHYSQPMPENTGSGQALTLRIRHDLLGQPGAAVEVTYAELDFDPAWEDYLLDFISAWHSGDYDRLRQLAVPEVVSYAVTTAPPIHPVLDPVAGGGGLLQVEVTNDAGFQLRLDVGTSKLGGPQAIVGYAP